MMCDPNVENVLQRMQSSLACTICLDLLDTPMTTKCGHSFCQNCLDRLLKGARNSPPCPLCMAPITKRSLTKNQKISSLVNAVRNVIASIKKDCGFQEPNKQKPTSTPENIEAYCKPDQVTEAESDLSIRRGTRKRIQVAHFDPEVFPKRKIKIRKADSNSNIAEEVSHSKETGESSSNLKEIKICAPAQERVEQWLNKTHSIQFKDPQAPQPLPSALPSNINDEDDFVPTQVFVRESEGESIKKDESMQDLAKQNVGDFVSQTSTVVFKYEDILPKSNEATHKSEILEEEEAVKEETNSVMSEKENLVLPSASHSSCKTRVGKRILSEANKLDPIKSITSYKDEPFQSDDLKLTGKSENYNPDNTKLFQAKIKKAEQSKMPLKVLATNNKITPNRKGHNIRFASEIKTKLLSASKPAVAPSKAKAKKSPGWSRVQSARKDLRSKHVSLDIKESVLEGKLESSKSLPESSQESVMVIEDDPSQVSPVKELSEAKKKRPFKRLQSSVVGSRPKKLCDNKKGVKGKAPKNVKIESKVDTDEGKLDNLSETTLGQHTVVQESSESVLNFNERGTEHEKDKTAVNCMPQLSVAEVHEPGEDGCRKAKPTIPQCTQRGRLSRRNASRNSKLRPPSNWNQTDASQKKDFTSDEEEDCLLQTKQEVLTQRGVSLQTQSEEKMNQEEKLDSDSNEILPVDVHPELPSLQAGSVPFLLKTSLRTPRRRKEQLAFAGRTFCHHSIPCEMFKAMMSFSSHVKTYCSSQSCSGGMPMKIASGGINNTHPTNTSCEDVPAASTNPSLLRKSNDEVSIVPESCLSQFEQEVAVILPDEVPGTTLRLMDNNVSPEGTGCHELSKSSKRHELGESASPNKVTEDPLNELNCGVNESVLVGNVLEPVSKYDPFVNLSFDNNCLVNIDNEKECSLVDIADSCSQKTTLSQSQIPSLENVHDTTVIAKENTILTQRLNTSVLTQKSQAPGALIENGTCPSLIDSPSKMSSESPINYKRTRRIQTLESSSSSSEDDLPDLIRTQKRKRKDTSRESPPAGKRKHEIDSEELRDFERYDENIWNYYNSKRKENGDNEKREGLSSQASDKCSSITEVQRIDDEISDDDIIPCTDEVLKNIESDMNLVNEIREQRVKEFTDSEASEIEKICSQESVESTSTMVGMSGSASDLLKKISQTSKSEAPPPKVKQSSLDSFTLVGKEKESSFQDRGTSHSEEDDLANASHSSMFSTQNLVISTQKRNLVQEEVNTLRNKILALEEEMKKKEATLNLASSSSSKISGLLESSAVASASKLEDKTELDRDKEVDKLSDVGSEDLFKSFPLETFQSKFTDKKRGTGTDSSRKLECKDRKPISLVCTGLTQSEITKVHTFAKVVAGPDARVTSKWTEGTTHVVVSVDDKGTTERTLKYLFGVASGAWILSSNWVEDSLCANHIMPEEHYEALDCTGAPGPKRGRLIEQKIFVNAQFLLVPPFDELTTEQLEQLIRICGGSVVKRFNENTPGIKLIVVNSDTNPESERMSKTTVLRKRSKLVVTHEWLIECIGMCALISLTNYLVGTPSQKEIAASGIPESLLYETQDFL